MKSIWKVKIAKMDLLVSLYIFCIAISEMMGAKTFPLFKVGDYQLNSSVAIFVVPLIFSINDIVTEVYGKERTRSIIKSGLLIVALILIMSLLSTALPPSKRFESSEAAFDTVFHKSARISFASLLAFATAEFLDVYIFTKIRKMLGKKDLWLRVNVSNFLSQLTDTIIFMSLAFYSFNISFNDNFQFIISIAIPWWLLKSSMSIVETPFVYLGVRWLKHENNSDKDK